MTVLGIDISKWNGNWDAYKAKSAGASFVFAKASQAAFTDIKFVSNWQKAKEAGLLRGAYHYLDYTKSGADQANYFADLLAEDPGELPPTVDYELRRPDNSPAKPFATLKDFLNTLIGRTELFTDMTVKKPMLYTSPGFWLEYGKKTEAEYWCQFPLWLAHYTTSATPTLPQPWPMWTFWQFTAKGPGEAFGSESLSVDMNRFNGTLQELLEFTGVQIPLSSLSELYSTLEQRTSLLEQSLTGFDPARIPDLATLQDRLAGLEQKVEGMAQTVTAPLSTMQQRLTVLEQKVSSPGSSISTPVPPASSSPTSSSTNGVPAIVKTKALNVRRGPGASYDMVGGVYENQQVNVLKRQNGWAQIEEPAGWCSEFYLSFDTTPANSQNSPTTTPAASTVVTSPASNPIVESTETSSTTPAAATESYAVCKTSGLNVRNGPGVSFPIVGGLTYGQRIKITQRQNGWAQIEHPAGWSNESYLSIA